MHCEDPDITEEDAILNRTIYDSDVKETEEEASAVSSHQDTTADHSNTEAPIIVSGLDLTPADIARTAARKAEHDENVPTSDGIPGNTYRIEYEHRHNHPLGDKNNIGTQFKSGAMRERIKAMLMRGMSINAIMDRLTMDYASFSRFLEDPSHERLSRDKFISYEDVYNIAYVMNAKVMRKHADQTVSVRLWMKDLERQGFFTYYDREHALFHGFSSPWQLDQLRMWGDVFCFDGTHHDCGKDTNLYSIVVKNRETGFSVPVAFFLTKLPHRD
ncbi:hypothetical protein KVV02_003870 [Mortierella alpina]|uniref:Uncharacterized protein n=1 Tax=Mortierella alpina TaxID=64518 RepID=A0A9P7ZZ84_MORAP|nr:hypothetical protein KVV02_003870 [Mortierella alpina]